VDNKCKEIVNKGIQRFVHEGFPWHVCYGFQLIIDE
jgi:hypothetical protein